MTTIPAALSARAQVKVVPWHGADPARAFAALQAQGRAGIFWLDSSSAATDPAARFSIMGSEPLARFRAWGGRVRFERAGEAAEETTGDPLGELERRLAEFRVESGKSDLPFSGGAVGFLSYDLGRVTEPAAFAAGDASDDTPDINLAWYDAAAVWDHGTGQAWLVGVGWRRAPEAAIAELAQWLSGATEVEPALPAPVSGVGASNLTRADFITAVERVRERIAAGEIYQMNLAQCFRGALAEPPAVLYRRLRALNPAPMAAYLDAGEGLAVLSSSPERFIEVQGDRIRTAPIKGTRPRGLTPEEDAAQRASLLASEKERAELLMIVDLLRNDLGRVCRFGSVQVRRLHSLESFATVHHLVGEVEGELRPEIGVAALLRAVFPGGSITGAPKVRAMQTIAEIEPGRRGVFSGAIGYFSACGRIDLNIAIRTIVCRGVQAGFHVGAGIVWDSDPAAEYEETLAKGRALFAALGWTRAGEGGAMQVNHPEPTGAVGVTETLLVHAGRIQFFDAHLRRFAAGCAYYGFRGPSDETLREAAGQLLASKGLAEGVLRWSAWRTAGGCEWQMTLEPPRPHMAKLLWTAVCTSALPPPDSARPHKHLGRHLWREALVAARAQGYEEVLLTDPAGLIVEGAISNVFGVIDGMLRTPPLVAGPLPGVTRTQVLALAAELGIPVAETALTPADLHAAQELFVTNALVGVRPLCALDGRAKPAPGPVTQRLLAAWRELAAR
ncbi:MAG: aminodeoxychorismate synthase component I [Verrucomicrobia bacterium]|nr:aminodeoxychorismate synthase component I [Verrucomicrobiota bacterium]